MKLKRPRKGFPSIRPEQAAQRACRRGCTPSLLKITHWLAALYLFVAVAAHAETWRFAVIGDTPYSDHERRELPSMLGEIAAEIADKRPEFVVHVGDFKKSSARCSDEIFVDRYALFNASKLPLIYVPGDNEWTDCKHLIAGHYDELERLAKLRQLFFAEPRSLGQTSIALERQSSAFPEHLRWRLGPLLFVTLNVPGPNNNFGIGQDASAEFRSRNPALIDWLRQGFATARREHSAAIVIAMQGNPGFKHFAAGLTHSGYRELLETLRNETLSFPGQVLLVHGDTHWQRIDHPLRNAKATVANFTRLESFGYPFMGWVKVIADTQTPGLFRFEVQPRNPQRIHGLLPAIAPGQ
ncbi:MAG: putative transrane protein [Proteobacteria bacterium]|nr:putative transrane protein [Pseudomonadota bacterium]